MTDAPFDFKYIELGLLPISLGFGAVAAWGDLKPMVPYLFGRTSYHGAVHGRIANRLLLVWLVFGVFFLAASGVWLAADWEFPNPASDYGGLPYPLAVLVNAMLAFLLGFCLWLGRLWAAGDAKMFALLALTMPLFVYQKNYLNYFPSFALFFNTFMAVFLLLVVELVAKTGLILGRSKFGFLKESVLRLWKGAVDNRVALIKLVLFFFAVFTIIRILRHLVRGGIDQLMEMNKTVVYLILFFMFAPLKRLAQKKVAVVIGLLIVAGYAVYAFVFDPTGQAKYEFFNIGWLAGSIIVFRLIYDAYLKATDELEIPVEELKPGMILAPSTIEKFSERKQFFKEKLGDLSPDGISQEQVAALTEWYSKNEPGGLIAVSRTIPFAPALFLGAVLTLLSRGLVVVF